MVYFFSVRSIFISSNEPKSSIFTSGEATSRLTAFGVYEWNKKRSYAEKVKFSVSFML